MIKFENFKAVEKNASVDLRYCNYIADETDEEENIRIRILRDNDNRYYYHKMQNGNVIECFEIELIIK